MASTAKLLDDEDPTTWPQPIAYAAPAHHAQQQQQLGYYPGPYAPDPAGGGYVYAQPVPLARAVDDGSGGWLPQPAAHAYPVAMAVPLQQQQPHAAAPPGDAAAHGGRKRRDRGVRRCVYPLLLAHNLLHWAVLAATVVFILRVADLAGPLCDVNGCGLGGCDSDFDKCSDKNKSLTQGVTDDGMGDFTCCALKADVPFVSAARTAWATGIAACVVGWLCLLLGPAIIACRQRGICCCRLGGGSGGGADGGAARAPLSPFLLRVPVLGASYAYRAYRRAARLGGGGGGDDGECCEEASVEAAAAARKARLRALWSLLSSTALADSLGRDVLLTTAGALWVWHAEGAWVGTSAAAAAAGGAGGGGGSQPFATGPLRWTGPTAFGSVVFAASGASLVSGLCLRSRAILAAVDDGDDD